MSCTPLPAAHFLGFSRVTTTTSTDEQESCAADCDVVTSSHGHRSALQSSVIPKHKTGHEIDNNSDSSLHFADNAPQLSKRDPVHGSPERWQAISMGAQM